jgi:hypothetical protein
MPLKNTKRATLLVLEILPALNSKYPNAKLIIAHNTFVVGDDKPLPGGFAKGVGKLSPEIP